MKNGPSNAFSPAQLNFGVYLIPACSDNKLCFGSRMMIRINGGMESRRLSEDFSVELVSTPTSSKHVHHFDVRRAKILATEHSGQK